MSDIDGSITTNQTDLALGDEVTFATTIDGNVRHPRIEVLCYQGEDNELVFGMAGNTDYSFLLGGGGSIWKDRGGPAHCVANLFYWDKEKGQQVYRWIASTEFGAGG